MKTDFSMWLKPLCRPALCALLTVNLGGLATEGAETIRLDPIADAFVATGVGGSLNGNNFGAAGSLAVSAGGLPGGQFQSVLKFDLSGARSALDAEFGAGKWVLDSVGLKLTSSPHGNPIFNLAAPGQFGVSLMQNNAWQEGTGTGGKPGTVGISFNTLLGNFVNQNADVTLGSFTFSGGSSGDNEYRLELAPGLLGHLQSGSELSLRLYPTDNVVSYLFDSRTAGGDTSPELVIVASPEPAILGLGLAGAALLGLCRFRGYRR